MFRYSTKPLILLYNVHPGECDVFELVFKQGDHLIVKNKTDLSKEIENVRPLANGFYEMEFSFTQEECGSFKADEWIYTQANILISNVRDSSEIQQFYLKDVLKEGVIGEISS